MCDTQHRLSLIPSLFPVDMVQVVCLRFGSERASKVECETFLGFFISCFCFKALQF